MKTGIIGLPQVGKASLFKILTKAHLVPTSGGGSEASARFRGTLRLEGKEYIVKDGDVMHVRHGAQLTHHGELASRSGSSGFRRDPGECCRTFANPNLKGLGRIVVAFPEGSKAAESHIKIFKADGKDYIADKWGGIAADLVPGQYDVQISGRRVAGVAVRAGHDTKIRAGTLRVQAGGDTHVHIFQRGGKDRLHDFWGSADVGLPMGEYDVVVADQRAPVAIKEDMITEF